MANQITSNFAICDNCFIQVIREHINELRMVRVFIWYVCMSVCLPVSLSVWLSICLSVCPCTCLSFCLSVYMSVYLSICLLLLVFEIFFLLFYQDPQYVSVGSNGEASSPQELKQVCIVTFCRCFETFCVSGIVWTFSLKLNIYIFILKSYVVCELQNKISLIYSFIKNVWKIRFWFSCLVVNR